MKSVVFLGPTLSVEDARRELDALYLPPVAQGDVYRIARQKPFAIGIVDGVFDRRPAVWHKEILWALAQGVHVLGAASMGALRAAELADFGMRGIGAIYEAVRSGLIEDDDEVAVAHGDARTGYRSFSEPLVNIRANLHAAQASGSLGPDSARRLEALAKSTFYPDRCYPELLSLARKDGLPAHELEAFSRWLATERINQKRDDALALLRALRLTLQDGAPPPSPRFTFSHTAAWSQVVDSAAGERQLSDPTTR